MRAQTRVIFFFFLTSGGDRVITQTEGFLLKLFGLFTFSFFFQSFLPFLGNQKRLLKFVLVYLSSFLLLLSILIMIRIIGRMIKIHLSSQSFPAHEPRSRFRDPLLLFFSARQRRPQRDVGNVQNEQTENHPVRGVF